MTTAPAHVQATIDDVHEILGPGTDPDFVGAVLRTGASREEILEAFAWIEDDDYMGAELERAPSARAQRVYELLNNQYGDEDERR